MVLRSDRKSSLTFAIRNALKTHQDEPYRYRIVFPDRRGVLGEHTFTNHPDFSSEKDILPLPSPSLLAAHASLARVFRASGAGAYFESLFRDIEEIEDFPDDVGWGQRQLDTGEADWHRFATKANGNRTSR